jgi:hypothetical protein
MGCLAGVEEGDDELGVEEEEDGFEEERWLGA